MKISFTTLAAMAIVSMSSVVFADNTAQTTTRTTSDYSETQTSGSQVIKFTGDDLPADGPDIYGGLVKAPPRSIRAGLLKPRMNFVPELLKSVENL